MTRLLLALCLLVLVPRSASATWSVIAIDTKTGQVIIASATCVRQSAFPQRTPVPARDLPCSGPNKRTSGTPSVRSTSRSASRDRRDGSAARRAASLVTRPTRRIVVGCVSGCARHSVYSVLGSAQS